MNNAVFGKIIENVYDRVDVELLIKWKDTYWGGDRKTKFPQP